MREFAINLLYYFSGADSGMARTVAQQDTCVSLLVGFIEQVDRYLCILTRVGNPPNFRAGFEFLQKSAPQKMRINP